MQVDSIPFGYCQCGCGEKTAIANQTRVADGITKGQPNHFLTGHGQRGQEKSPLAYRLWSKVDKNGPVPTHAPELGPCWVWTACVKQGYGRLNVKVNGRPNSYRAHRLAWELTFGSVPDGLFVLHKCDNPPCVNPGHLYVGTQTENNRDRDTRGRHRALVGSENGSAKLTDAAVRAIRACRAAGIDGPEIATMFNVSTSVVYDIANGRRWTHIT